jgi:K+/H+ antiporter YhaU regulatory subunit KhtT
MMVDPSPDTTLAPLDRLFIVGEPSHISRAEALLQLGFLDKTASTDQTVVRELRLTGESLCVGATLQDLQVAERTGARVIGIVREEERIRDPAPETRLEAEDILLIMGKPESISQAEVVIQNWCPIGPDDA